MTGAAALLAGGAGRARADGPIRIAVIDPLSGPFAEIGDRALKHFEYCAARIGAASGRPIEIVPFDSRLDPNEARVHLARALREGVRYIAHGFGSAIASAIIADLTRHADANPSAPALYLNYGAIDPALTNERCSPWHVRFDADLDMKMAALVAYLQTRKDIGRVFLLNQDYPFGRAVAAAARRMLAVARPDIAIAGAVLHPVGTLTDFAPLVAQMQAAEADAVITGNWGTDVTELVKAAAAAEFRAPFLTYFGGGYGAPAAMGRAAIDIVHQVSEFHTNIEGLGLDEWIDDFKATTGYDFHFLRIKTLIEMLASAVAQSEDSAPAVMRALAGMKVRTATGHATLRADNHQLLQPLFVSHLSEDVAHDVFGTGLGWRTDLKVPGSATAQPTTCRMMRPAP